MDAVKRAVTVMAAALAALAGCASEPAGAPGPGKSGPRLQFGEAGSSGAGFVTPAGRYAEAFESAKSALREMGFALGRVDAAAGVIMTRPRWSGGLATPWVEGESDFQDEVDSALNTTRRVVRVRFEPVRPAQTDEEREEGSRLGAAVSGVAAFEAGAKGVVDAIVERVYTPGRQVQAVSIRRSGYFEDIEVKRGEPRRESAVSIREDPALSARVASEIERRLSGAVEGGK